MYVQNGGNGARVDGLISESNGGLVVKIRKKRKEKKSDVA